MTRSRCGSTSTAGPRSSRASRARYGSIAFTTDSDSGATLAELELEYELQRFEGFVGAVTDRLFIRRALRDAVARTLRRFATEAEEQAMLAGERPGLTEPGGSG